MTEADYLSYAVGLLNDIGLMPYIRAAAVIFMAGMFIAVMGKFKS